MGDWYWIGVVAGVGVALGVLLSGLLGGWSRAALAAAVPAAAGGVGVGFLVDNWNEALGGGIGGVLGALGAAQVVGGALQRGGTRGGTALLVAGGSLALAALALIPVVVYLAAVAVPALAARLRRRAGERYAVLRGLAR